MNSIPPGVWNAIDYERLAVQSMDAGRYAYVAGGCGWDRAVAANRARLRDALDGVLQPAWDGEGTPFCHAVLADDRDGLIRRLHARRVFATPLWPDSLHDAARHPRAADLCPRLLALPVDPRYDGADMDLLSRLVLDAVREGKTP